MVWAVSDLCALGQVLSFVLDTEKERGDWTLSRPGNIIELFFTPLLCVSNLIMSSAMPHHHFLIKLAMKQKVTILVNF